MTTIDTYTITIERDEEEWLTDHVAVESALAEAEENLTLLLPHGHRAVIRRWDEGDEDE